MEIKQCNRNPMCICDFAYDGVFSDGEDFCLRIPEEDVVEFAQNLLKAYKADKNGDVKVTPPCIVNGIFVDGKVEAVKQDM